MFENGTTVFGINFGDRQTAAEVRQEKTNVERGAALFAQNCRACHGLTGEGSAERGGLPGAALNTPTNYDLPESQIATRQQRLKATIECGRVGTLMPPWSIDEGGSLNFFQIEQLVTLITSKYAPEGWDFVIEAGNHSDILNPEAHLVEPVSETATELSVSDATAINEQTLLRIGLDEPGEPYELFLVTGVDREANTVTVERGPDVTLDDLPIGTDPIEHEAGATIYNGPILPSGSIIGAADSEATPPCGQNKAAPVNAGGPVDVADGATINMNDNFFEVDGETNPEMHVAADTTIGTVLDNIGAAVHNFRIAGEDGEYDTADDIISDPDLIPGGSQGAATIELPAGTYPYRCDFHPDTMLGDVVAE
jgi:mono/diheme cytochrome c family protein